MADNWTYVGDENAIPAARSFYFRSKVEGTHSFQVVNVDCLAYRDGPENVFELCLGEVDLEDLTPKMERALKEQGIDPATADLRSILDAAAVQVVAEPLRQEYIRIGEAVADEGDNMLFDVPEPDVVLPPGDSLRAFLEGGYLDEMAGRAAPKFRF